jgi:hypothetical protein
MAEPCFQHEMRGGGTCKRQRLLPPLTPTLSPSKQWGEGEVEAAFGR